MTDASTAGRVFDETADTLRGRFGGAATEEAAVLVADALGEDERELLTDLERPVSSEVVALSRERAARRAGGEPLAYVLGWCVFRGLRISVDERAVVPRDVPTGLLVDVAGELPLGARVVDVGTGSGAVALAVASERPDLEVTASDLSPEALEVARTNAVRLGLRVRFVVADGVPPGEYDLVVANPPYARADELAEMAPEVAGFQPHLALVAGDDGLDVTRRIVATAPSGVRIAVEHTGGQEGAVRALLVSPETRRDPRGGTDAVTVGRVT